MLTIDALFVHSDNARVWRGRNWSASPVTWPWVGGNFALRSDASTCGMIEWMMLGCLLFSVGFPFGIGGVAGGAATSY